MRLIIIIAVVFLIIPSRAISQHLTVGDHAPSLVAAEKWLKGQPVPKFNREKIYVVEFGATWCSPCAAAIPHLSALSEKYSQTVQIISVFVQEDYEKVDENNKPTYANHVEKYILKQGSKIKYTVAMDGRNGDLNRNWLTASGKVGVPHMFVVDRDGYIAWIGSNPDNLDVVINKLMNEDYSISKMLPTIPLQKAAAGAGFADSVSGILYNSILSKYTPKTQKIENSVFVDNFRWASEPDMVARRGKVEVRGGSLRGLFYVAYGDTLWQNPPHMILQTGEYFDTLKTPHQKRSYGKFWYKPILLVKDSSIFDIDYKSPVNTYDYFLRVPLNKASSAYMQKTMQQDLSRYFDYEVSVERRMMPCWKLIANDSTRKALKARNPNGKFRSYQDKNGNYVIVNGDMREIISQLEIRYGYIFSNELIEHPDHQPPFIDTTGIQGKIDYVLDGRTLDYLNDHIHDPRTFEQYRKLLRGLGLELVKSRKSMNVVVIRDAVHLN